ncbi:MAG: hypothetical protein BWY75_00850 [bacterium ADurb.Bin425]|jgi:hypothetical protein|nr:MAG: hypothetical protein BWY75_00850 [bacterium ADurb.Bin425]
MSNIIINAATFGLNAKFDGIVNQFIATELGKSGWSWRDAIEVVLEDGGTIQPEKTALGLFLASEVSKGWTWHDAIEASIDAGHQVNLAELPLADFVSDIELPEVAEEDFDEFEVSTGWTLNDALKMRKEIRREALFCGSRRRLH